MSSISKREEALLKMVDQLSDCIANISVCSVASLNQKVETAMKLRSECRESMLALFSASQDNED
jgi:hypothetical protein